MANNLRRVLDHEKLRSLKGKQPKREPVDFDLPVKFSAGLMVQWRFGELLAYVRQHPHLATLVIEEPVDVDELISDGMKKRSPREEYLFCEYLSNMMDRRADLLRRSTFADGAPIWQVINKVYWWMLYVLPHSHHITSQHNATQHNATQHNITQHNTTQPNTTQHNHNTCSYNHTVRDQMLQPLMNGINKLAALQLRISDCKNAGPEQKEQVVAVLHALFDAITCKESVEALSYAARWTIHKMASVLYRTFVITFKSHSHPNVKTIRPSLTIRSQLAANQNGVFKPNLSYR